uniref:Uncharacterized protein n=1 Tax=Arundo donax TaxID=35708 RepID=A0A0A9GRU1_ARUDO
MGSLNNLKMRNEMEIATNLQCVKYFDILKGKNR